MTIADVLIGVIWVGVTAYAVLGGADFGAGVLHLLAPAGPRGAGRRRAITDAMGPVWEANHVWLIFVLTGLLTVFPAAFAALGSALLLPATLALLGIVVRGAALTFAAHLDDADRARRPLQVAFGLASTATPVVLGAIAGGLARQRLVVAGGVVRADGGLGLWVGPLQLAVGLLALATCTTLAATFLTVEMRRTGEVALADAFRRVATRASAATAGLALAGVAIAADDAPALFRGLTGRGLPAAVVAALALVVTISALRYRRDALARASAATATAALVWGWGLAQFPRLAGPRVTVASAAAPAAELHAVALALLVGAILLVPALWLLYGAFRAGRRPSEVGP